MDVMELIKVKVSLSKNFHIPPSEIDIMPMWEYELYLKYLNEAVKDDNDAQKAEMDKYNIGDVMKASNPKNISKMMNQTQPKYPSMPNMKM